MNLAVIGSGGREHSICYKIKQSSKIKKINWSDGFFRKDIGWKAINSK
tara:strand:+ start:240 stop:383 length:144 start_codon:yes stop_codon:yes gene_type:complete